MSIEGNGDRLARGQKSATFSGGYGEGELKPSLAPEETIPDVVDNSALFAPKRPSVVYKGKPFNKRILVTRVELENNSTLIIPDSAKGHSDVGIIVQLSDDSELRRMGLKEGSMVLFDRYAACGQEFPLITESGDSRVHLLLQEFDVQMELIAVRQDVIGKKLAPELVTQ